MIERLAAARIPAAKYNLSILGVPRTAPEAGRAGSRNKAFRWSRADPDALMPDHVPRIDGRDSSGVAFAYCYGYIQGLIDTLVRQHLGLSR